MKQSNTNNSNRAIAYSQFQTGRSMFSPRSQPDALNKKSSRIQSKKMFHRQRKHRKELKESLIAVNSLQQSQFNRKSKSGINESILSFDFHQSPEEYLKVNKLWRVTNQTKSDEDEDYMARIPRFFFTPQQNFIVTLNLSTIFVIYLYFTQIPISIAFENHRQQQDTRRIFELINIPALVIFIFGSIIKIRTAYFSFGILIINPKKTAQNYLKTDFMIDLISISSIVIYEASEIYHEGPIEYRFIILLFYLKIRELVKMEKYLVNFFDMNRRVKAILKLSLLLSKIFLLCNIVACGFFYLSDNLCGKNGMYENCTECCWTTTVTFNKEFILRLDWNLQYMFSLYWASTTMISIGYGDVTPKNIYEIAYTVLVQFLSCLLYAYSINEIWQIIQQLNSKKFQIRNRLSVINTYCRDKKISKDLKSKINAYLLHFYHIRNVRDKDLQSEIIQNLTPSLKTDLYFQAYGFIFNNHSFFINFSSYVLEVSSRKIIQSSYFQDQIIFSPEEEQGENSLIYIQEGQVQNLIELQKKRLSIRKIYLNQIVGLKQFITQLNYKSSLIANKYTVVYKINFKDWKHSLQEEDQDFQLFYSIKDKIQIAQQYAELNMICEFCRMDTHCSEDCFTYQIDEKMGNFLKRYKSKNQRRLYKRQNKLSNHLSNEMFAIKSQKINISNFHFNKIDSRELNESLRNPRKVSLEFLPSLKRQLGSYDYIKSKKLPLNRKQKHREYINQIKSQFEQQGQDLSDLYSQDSEMLSTDYGIDKVDIYNWYNPSYNADNDDESKAFISRKRLTIQFKYS